MRLQTFLVLGFASLSIAALGLAWRQYHELARLRPAALRADERAAFETRIAKLAQQNRELEARLAALNGKNGASGAAHVANDPAGLAGDETTANPATLKEASAVETKREAELELLAALADVPEFQKLVALQERGNVDSKYAALFRRLHLSPEQQQKLESLLTDKQTAFADALVAARDQGLVGKDARRAAVEVARESQHQIDNSIQSLLGDQGFKQYQNYEHTLPQRETVNDLAQRLSYTSTPLSTRQQDQLVQALATGARQDLAAARAQAAATGQKIPRPATTLNSVPNGLGMLGVNSAQGAVITPTAVTNAQSFLSAQQLATLQQMAQEQQAQLTLGNLLRLGKVKPAPAPAPAPPPGKNGGG